LGIFADEQFAATKVQLAAGDRLFIYSDGIEVGFCGDDISDNTRWREQLQRRGHLPTDQILIGLSEELDKQSGSLQPKDDLTMIALEGKKNARHKWRAPCGCTRANWR